MRKRKESGQSLVEFALILPIILIVLLGLLNLGLAIRAHLQLAQEAQEAAQILVHHPEYADEFVVTVTAGNFTLTTSGGTGGTTASIAHDASPTDVQNALAVLPDVGSTGNVLVSGPGTGGSYIVSFIGTSTATGLTVNGASATSTSKLVDYIDNTLGSSYPVTDSRNTAASGNQSQVRVTQGTSLLSPGCTVTSTNNCDVVQDTVKIDYWFRVIFPMVGLLSVGPFQPGGFINLGATESTVVATLPASNVHVCVVWKDTSGSPTVYHGCPHINGGVGQLSDVGKHEVFWNQPKEAEPSPIGVQVPLDYCLTSYYPINNGTTASPLVVLQANPIACFPAPNPGATLQDWVDTTHYENQPKAYVSPSPGGIDYTQAANPSNPSIYYSVVAQELNGIPSASTVKTNQP